MNKHFLLSFVAIVLLSLLFACNPNGEQIDAPYAEGEQVTLTVAIGEPRPHMLSGMQRVSGKDTNPADPNNGKIQLTWDEGDKILVKVGDKSSIFTLSSGAGTKQATFIGTMPADGSTYSVQYPISEPNLAEQYYVQDGFGKDLMLMTTKTNGTIEDGFLLSADYALLGLQLTGDQLIGKIVLTNPVNGNTYTLYNINITLSYTPTLFYIVVPEGEWKEGFSVDVYAADNKTINKTLAKLSSICFSTISATIMPTQWTTPDAIDLGLSVKWGTCNLGASSPEEYGDYFAWGETEPKEVYSSATYKWKGTPPTKYNEEDGKIFLDLEDDAAHVLLGDKWHIPSNEKRNELIDNCDFIWTAYNGVAGFKAISKKNGNSIFLPAVGYKGSNSPYYPAGKSGLYWLRDFDTGNYAYLLLFDGQNEEHITPPRKDTNRGTRHYGFAIRPIYDDN